MRANPEFKNETKEFWANVRLISQEVGYTQRANTKASTPSAIKIPSLLEIKVGYEKNGLKTDKLFAKDYTLTTMGDKVLRYFHYRADVLNNRVQHYLMTAEQVKEVYNDCFARCNPKCHQPLNKQKGEKAGPAYFTCLINMLIEREIGDAPCDYNPLVLTTISKDGYPLRTFSRRVDGAFPTAVNPLAFWEIKEYYHTTSFGSRVAGGVYETLLDGWEFLEAEQELDIDIEHYLMIDAYYTWWDDGKSYLCRMIDMLNMGYLTEIIFGKEIFERVPEIAKGWLTKVTPSEQMN